MLMLFNLCYMSYVSKTIALHSTDSSTINTGNINIFLNTDVVMTSFSRKKLILDTDRTITKLEIMNIHYFEVKRRSECLRAS